MNLAVLFVLVKANVLDPVFVVRRTLLVRCPGEILGS